MVSGSFQVGQRFLYEGEEHRFLRKVEPNRWTFECTRTGSWREESIDHLLGQWTEGKLRFSGRDHDAGEGARQSAYKDAAIDAFRQSYPEQLWQRAKAKLVYVLRLRRAPLTKAAITLLIEEIYNDKGLWKAGQPFAAPPHFTTVAEWRRKYFKAGEDIRALCDRHHCKGNEDSRYGDEVDSLADDVIETTFLTPERPTIESCLEILRGRVARLNQTRLESDRLPRPTYNYLKRRIANLNAYDVCVARYGKRVADIRFRAAGLGPRAENPLARACIDHCRLDVMVVDEGGLPLGRPWLTVLIDEATRYILGFYIGFEEPSVVSVSRAVRCALMPKAALLAECPDIANEWDAWGVMDTLVADNGMEFHSGALEGAIGRFGIVLQFCPRRKPWFKGKIERFFRTLNLGLIGNLPGKTFSGIGEKFDYDPAKHAIVGLKTLRQVILTWIVDIYHQKSHRGLGMSPATAWKENISAVNRWLPPSSLSVQAAFSRSVNRRLTHKGIELDGLLYNSDDMRALRELHGSEIAVEVRVIDDDIGSVVIVHPEENEVIRVPALDQVYAAGLTRWQHQVCKRYQRRISDDESQDIPLLEARERIEKALEQERGRAKRLSKRIGRFLEGNEPRPARKPASKDVAAPGNEPPASGSSSTGAWTIEDEGEGGDWLPDLTSRRVDASVGGDHGRI